MTAALASSMLPNWTIAQFGSLAFSMSSPCTFPLTAARTFVPVSCYKLNLRRYARHLAKVSHDSLQLPQEEAEKNVPLEVVNGVRHDTPGVLSMGRLEDPNSGTSSFSILLGPAPHLDMKYTIFG